MPSFVMLAVLTLGVTQVTQGQTDISCNADTETEIVSPFLFTQNKTCPQLIGGIPDWYNEDYRRECAAWLDLENIPSDVSTTYVSHCNDFNNGTLKYRTKICCHGKPNVTNEDQLMCFTCDGEPGQFDSNFKYRHTEYCNHFAHNRTGPEMCSPGEVCSVEVHYNNSQPYGLVSKSCMSASECASRQTMSRSTCRNSLEPYCAYCYDTMYGNYKHPQRRLYVRGPCYSCHGPNVLRCLSKGTAQTDPHTCICRPGYRGWGCRNAVCSNGGTYMVTGNGTNDYECICRPGYTGRNCQSVSPCYWGYRCGNFGTCLPRNLTGYECLCRPGYFGHHCDSHECDHRPCKNGGICTRKRASPYYFCRCHLALTGYNCSEPTPLCVLNWCENGGTCYVQDGPDERCLCPDGFVGKRCEYTRPYDCGEDSELRSFFDTQNLVSDAHDCTYINDVYIQRYLNQRGDRYCGWRLRSKFGYAAPSYRPGIHGEVIRPVQAIAAMSCEQGRDYTWVTAQTCCSSCASNPCENGGWCMQGERSFTCRCRYNYGGRFCEKKLSSCYAAGDPHYYTFDGIRMHYQGACKYVMTEGLTSDNQTSFRVITKNEHRDNSPKFVTYPKYVEVEVYNTTFHLAKDNLAYVDGAQISSLPYEDDQKRFFVRMNGLKLRFETVFGLVVEFSDNWLIIVRVPGDTAGAVDGLCRNFNDDADDDYVLPTGRDVKDDPDRDTIIGNYFQINDPEDANCQPVNETRPVCDDAALTVIKSDAYCGHIKAESGPFSQCIRSATGNLVDIYMENCIYDVCAVYDDGEESRKTAACGSKVAFVEACQSESSPANLDWRTATRCVPECPGDLVYSPLTTACRVTCANPDPAKCTQPETENCICEGDMDVALDNNTCVHASECGCYEIGRKIGESWCNDNSTERNECVVCTDCAKPVGETKTSSVTDAASECPDTWDPCEDVVCKHSGECVPNTNSSSGYQCRCCPQWGGDHCEHPEKYNCQDKSPCTQENMFMATLLCEDDDFAIFFAHDNPELFIQCDSSRQCSEISLNLGGFSYN